MITNEIKKLITDLQEDKENNELSANFQFPASFPGFKGHFPQEAILPGVCQLEVVLAILSASLNNEIKLKSVSRAKFLNTVKPEEKIKVTGSYSLDANTVQAKFKITKIEESQEVNVSRISLQCELIKQQA